MTAVLKRPRRQPSDSGGGDDSFNVLFISLNLILLSFFILLNSLSVRDSKRVRKALGSLLGTFGILEGGQSLRRDGQSVLPSDPLAMGKKKKSKKPKSEEDELMAMLQKMRENVGKKRVKVINTADNLEVEMSDDVLFQPGGVELNPEIFAMLDQVARVMRLAGRTVTVLGYSDPRRPVNFPSNLELSGCRAVRVARYLVEAGGLDAQRVSAEGRGVMQGHGDHLRFVKIIVPAESLSRALESD